MLLLAFVVPPLRLTTVRMAPELLTKLPSLRNPSKTASVPGAGSPLRATSVKLPLVVPAYSAKSFTPGIASPPCNTAVNSYHPPLNPLTDTDGCQVLASLLNVAPAVPGAICPSRTRRVLPDPGV